MVGKNGQQQQLDEFSQQLRCSNSTGLAGRELDLCMPMERSGALIDVPKM